LINVWRGYYSGFESGIVLTWGSFEGGATTSFMLCRRMGPLQTDFQRGAEKSWEMR
jgi:hypothetical protein